jgi:hypothetical protein
MHFTVTYCRFMFQAPSLLLFSAYVISACQKEVCQFVALSIPVNPHSVLQ